jgi:hypothetical protein
MRRDVSAVQVCAVNVAIGVLWVLAHSQRCEKRIELLPPMIQIDPTRDNPERGGIVTSSYGVAYLAEDGAAVFAQITIFGMRQDNGTILWGHTLEGEELHANVFLYQEEIDMAKWFPASSWQKSVFRMPIVLDSESLSTYTKSTEIQLPWRRLGDSLPWEMPGAKIWIMDLQDIVEKELVKRRSKIV